MDNIRKILADATMAHTNMNINIDSKKIVQSIFELLEENKDNIVKANNIDVENDNGFIIDFEKIDRLKNSVSDMEDLYRKVISMNKNENNYLEGKQTDKLGTICLVYEGNTYCLLELIIKSILTHNSIVITCDSDYMKATNEFILILIKRILTAYSVDKNLIQILYTSRIEELLSNSISINKVFVIGSKELQNKVKKLSKAPVIAKGFNYFDLYVEDLTHLSFIETIIKEEKNIDVYVKKGLKVPFEDYIEVEDYNEVIAQINFNSSGFSSSIFTNNSKHATKFLRDVKTDNISVNSSPLIQSNVDIDINLFVNQKNMFYPSPLAEENEKNKFEFPTARAILEDNKNKENEAIIEQMKKENLKLKQNNENIQKQIKLQNEQKELEVNELKRQLNESQCLANKYISVFRKSFFSRLFGKIKLSELEKDTKLLS